MILKKTDVKPGLSVSLVLPADSIPQDMINQGLNGVFLWYLDSGKSENANFKFHFIGKGGEVNPSWQRIGTFKDDNYKQVYWEK